MCHCEPQENRTPILRVLSDGSLDFVGGLQSGSSFIKLRAYRIELSDVLGDMEGHGAVDRAVVIVDESRQQLVAFVA